MRVRLEYGRGGLLAEVPDSATVATPLKLNPPLNDPRAALLAGLSRPLCARPLADVARDKSTACLVVCDFTRPVPNAALIEPIVSELESVGVVRSNITILVATGTHRACTPFELDAMLGVWASACKVVSHTASVLDANRYLGETERGTPVWLNRHYLDSEIRITLGMIEPHFMAGFSGGRKMIMPGIAGMPSVLSWHSPRFLEHPLACAGQVDGNPVHLESLAIAGMAPPDLAVDVTLNFERRITGVFVGDLDHSWRRGVEFVRPGVTAVVPQPVDIAITTGGGWPLDATYYQAVKGMVAPLPILKSGGTIIIAAECAQGIGGPEFSRQLTEAGTLEQFVHHISQAGAEPVTDQWQLEELAKAARGRTIHCISSGIDRYTLKSLFVRPAASVEEALHRALNHHGSGASIAVLPVGPYGLYSTGSDP